MTTPNPTKELSSSQNIASMRELWIRRIFDELTDSLKQ